MRFLMTYLGEPHHDRPYRKFSGDPWAVGETRELTEDVCQLLGKGEETSIDDFSHMLLAVENLSLRLPRFDLTTEDDVPAKPEKTKSKTTDLTKSDDAPANTPATKE